MTSRWGPTLVCLAVALVSAPRAAHAWTEADVVSARAHVVVRPDATALVSLVVTVHVRGGWLEGLELADLDPGLTLDESKPPWAVSLDEPDVSASAVDAAARTGIGGRKWAPSVRVRQDGATGPASTTIQLGFPRRDAPTRGRIEVGLVYRADLDVEPVDDGLLRATWTLPSFRSGLDEVDIAVSAPPGTVLADADAGGEVGSGHVLLEREGVSVHLFHRVHLPRTVAWSVSVDVPEDAMAESLRSGGPVASRKADDARVTPERPADDPFFALLAVLAVLVVLGRDRAQAHCERRGSRARPLVPGGTVVASLLAGAVVVVAVLADGLSSSVGLGALGALSILALQRPARAPSGPPRLTTFRPATRSDRRAARRARLLERLGAELLFDATTPLGLLCVTGVVLAALVLAAVGAGAAPRALAAVALLALPFVSGTRHAIPPSSAAKLARAERIARALSTSRPCALGLALRVDRAGTTLDARITIHPADAPDGLERLEIALDAREDLGVCSLVPRLLVVTRADSAADLTLANLATPDESIARRRGRVLDADRLDAVLDALAGGVAEASEPAPFTEVAPATDRAA